MNKYLIDSGSDTNTRDAVSTKGKERVKPAKTTKAKLEKRDYEKRNNVRYVEEKSDCTSESTSSSETCETNSACRSDTTCDETLADECKERLACGCGMIKWKGKCGEYYLSKIVSLASKKALECSIDKFINYLSGLYNSCDSLNISRYQVSQLGLFAENSTVFNFRTSSPLPSVAVGVDGCSIMLSEILSSIKQAHPTSQLCIKYSYRLTANDLANITYEMFITWVDGDVHYIQIIVFFTQVHVIACGTCMPKVDFGQIVTSGSAPA